MSGSELLSTADRSFAIALLGGFAVFFNGSALGIPNASQRLVAFLALRGRLVRRAVVAGTLWPDSSQSQAHANLRSALSRIQARAREMLVASKLELGLAEGVSVDMHSSQALARRLLDPTLTLDSSHLSMATISALSSDLLPGWYDDWVLAEAEDWRQLRVHALEALATHLASAGRWGAAAGAARAAVRAEPLRESGHVALIEVYLAEGNQSEAMRQFASYRALLHAELQLEPTRRLCELVQGLHGP